MRVAVIGSRVGIVMLVLAAGAMIESRNQSHDPVAADEETEMH